MGRKLNAPKYQIWDQVDTATNPTSISTSVKQIDHVCYEVSYDSTVLASLGVQFSNDDETTPPASWVWRDVEFGQAVTLDGSLDTETNVVFREMPYKNLRLKVTNAGGTGNITAFISGQGRGA